MNIIRNEDLPVLEDVSIILRPIQPEDTEFIVKWRNDQSVSQNFVFREKITSEDHMKWYHEKVLTGQVVQYIIVESKTGLPMGSVYFRDIDSTHNHAEFGIFIGEKSMRGKGYGKQACKRFTEFGFEQLGLHKIYLRVFADNFPAIQTYNSIGYQLEGIAKDLVYVDHQYKTMLFMAKNQGL